MKLFDLLKITSTLFSTLLFLFTSNYGYAFTVKSLSNSVYDNNIENMDANIGIQGYIIEDFEDINLVNGLTVEVSNPNHGPTTILPTTYKPRHNNNTWDGTYAFTNACSNGWNNWDVGGCNTIYAQITTFSIVNGTESFAIGLANFQVVNSRTDLLVNGNKLATIDELTNYHDGIDIRNLFIIIESDNNERIDTVSFKTQTETPCEGLVFDHLAFKNFECNYNDSDGDGVVDLWDKCSNTPNDSWVNRQGCPANNLYTEEQMNQMVSSILLWGDLNGDNKINLIEAIKALRTTSGVTDPDIK